jgi:hypothetical protein
MRVACSVSVSSASVADLPASLELSADMTFQKRLALWLCRAAGLTDVAVHREELDDLRESKRRLEAAHTAELKLLQAIAQQTNSNTLMLKRWLEEDNSRREFQSRQRQALAGAREQLLEAETKSRELTERIDGRKKAKTDAIAGAKMPVDGLSFGDGMVMFNGFPLDQASAAEKLRVSFAVAMAMNPKLRVVLIRDGSLLDEDSMALVEQMADAHDYQVFVEIVRKDSPVGVVIEDGEVVAVDGVPVEAVAAAGD